MSRQTYEKPLTANDTGQTCGHQAGIHIPKSQKALLSFLPKLDGEQKNPDAWIKARDDTGKEWKFRYIYYNNKFHDEGGTRDEFRITHMTKFFREVDAKAGDTLVLSGFPNKNLYSISVRKTDEGSGNTDGAPRKVRLKGWRRVY